MIDTRLFAFAALALSLAACTNDNEVMNNGPVAAVINAEISDAVATRASGTTWDEMKTTASVLPASAPSMTTCPTS